MKRLSNFSLAFAICVGLAAVQGAGFATPTSFVSDDFNAYNLNRTLWTFTDPTGDAGIEVSGTGTTNARLSLTVPGGVSHDLWIGGNEAPHIMQPSTNTNFEIEVKFESGVTGVSNQAFVAQGILVQQDASNVIRFDFTTGDQDSMKVFSAAFIGGFGSPSVKINKNIGAYNTQPLYMRVKRVGSTLTMSYSLDGITYAVADSFLQALTVTQVGFFAANAGPFVKKHTATLDYFFNRDSVISPEDGKPVPPDAAGPFITGVQTERASNALRISWYTDEPADGEIQYGLTPSYGGSVGHGGAFTYHILNVPGLVPDTEYNFRIRGTDERANTGASGNFVTTTLPATEDLTTVSDDFNAATLNTALWTYTNPKGDVSQSLSGSQLSMVVPGGVSHDLWIGGNFVPRVMQPLGGGDFQVVAKFTSGVTGTATSVPFQGIIIQADSVNLIRFDVGNAGSGTRVFSAIFRDGFSSPDILLDQVIGAAGITPTYLRVTRTGALWIMDYSLNGTSWTNVTSFYEFFNATQIGVFAGNGGSAPPAFTAMVDFFQASLPAKPRLTSPAAGATNVVTPPTLVWDTTAGATSYRLQVSTDSLFGTTVFNDSTITVPSRQVAGLVNQVKYFWRVRGKNLKGVGAYSNVFSFTTGAPAPAAPTLVSPANNATGLDTSVTLSWTKPATATSYRLQVGTDSTFASGVVFNDSTITDSVRTVGGLAYGGKYYWRVNAKNAGGTGPYSAVRNFSTLVNDPNVPLPVSPANGATNQDTSVTLRWRKPVGVITSYRVQVATDSTFASGIILDDAAVADTTRVVGGLSFLTKYYWRVNADGSGGTSAFSSVYNFTTGLPLPGQVTLLAPGPQAIIAADSVTFRWQASQPGVTRYWHELAIGDSTFTGFVLVDSSLTDTSKVSRQLLSNQTYYWRVRGRNQSGWGPFSTIRSFTITTTGVGEGRGIPTEFSLSQNYPNPFNPSTRIEYALPVESHATLEVYNLLGEMVARLVDEVKPAGYYSVNFNASSLGSGLYFYRLSTGQQSFVRKMMLVK